MTLLESFTQCKKKHQTYLVSVCVFSHSLISIFEKYSKENLDYNDIFLFCFVCLYSYFCAGLLKSPSVMCRLSINYNASKAVSLNNIAKVT